MRSARIINYVSSTLIQFYHSLPPFFLSAHFANKARLLVGRHQPVFSHFETDTDGGPSVIFSQPVSPSAVLKNGKLRFGWLIGLAQGGLSH